MAAVVHYEVYAQERRGWTLQGRYPGDERARAIDDAKALEEHTRLPVRVTREIYYPNSNEGEEVLVYRGRFKPRTHTGQAPVARAGGGIEAAARQAGTATARGGGNSLTSAVLREPARSTTDFMFRVILVMIMSLVIAVLGTGMASLLMSGGGQGGSTQSLVLFLIFMGLFLMTAVPLVMRFIPLDAATSRTPERKPPGPSAASAFFSWLLGTNSAPDTGNNASDTQDAGNAAQAAAKAERKAAEAAEKEKKATKQAPPPPPEPPAPKPEAPATIDPAEAARTAEKKAAEQEKQAAQAAEANSEPPEDPTFEKCRLVAMKFLGGAVNAIKATHPQLDAYNKFGVNLFLAGACTALAKARGIDDAHQELLVRECVEVIGTRPEQARQLVQRLPHYRKEPRYRQMIAAGFTAMEVGLSGHSDPFIAMGGVMKDWNTPQARQVGSSAVTLMFTDMVGSTDITQAIGDMAAQDIIRAHNHIVRLALSHFGGKEVKHTGDGIMASFDDPAEAVRAAMDIQARAAEHTARWPRLPLHLRIGMNTGEPIIEENDYFGATVQIAARVCALAGTGQVWLSQATHALVPPSPDMVFADHGPHDLKGVKDQVHLFEAVWEQDRRAALLAEAARAGELTADAEDTDIASADGSGDGAPPPPDDGQPAPVPQDATTAPEEDATPATTPS